MTTTSQIKRKRKQIRLQRDMIREQEAVEAALLTAVAQAPITDFGGQYRFLDAAGKRVPIQYHREALPNLQRRGLVIRIHNDHCWAARGGEQKG